MFEDTEIAEYIFKGGVESYYKNSNWRRVQLYWSHQEDEG